MKRSSVIILLFVLVKFLLQLSALLQLKYGLFRDELYYLACAKHRAWGFVDHPPFSIAVLWTWVSIAGDSLVSLHVLAALIGTIPIAMAGLITRQLGGEWKAQALACFAVLLAPIQIGISSFYSMNVDRICTYSFARLVVTPNYYRTAIILVDSVWRIAWCRGYE